MRDNVVVTGGGPVGLVTALGLAQQGVKVTLIEKEQRVGVSPRAIAYLYPVLSGFEKLGILDEIESTGHHVDAITFIDFDTKEVIAQDTTPLQGHHPHPYNLTLGQHRISEIVLRRIQDHPNVTVLFGTQLTAFEQTSDGVVLELSDDFGSRTLETGWLVGADGASSFVRQHLGLSYEGITWPDRLISTNIRYDFRAAGYGEANFVVHPQYGAVIARIEGDLWRCTYREEGDLDDEGITSRMKVWMDAALPGESKDFELVQFAPYRIHQRSANRFRVGRVLLAGDSAHITNPIGGLGLTTGFLDAFVLYEALAAVINGDESASILDAYDEERRSAFLDIISPRASENKVLLYNMTDRAALEGALTQIRAVAADSDARREQLLSLQDAVTPPLVGRVAAAS